MPDDHGNLAPWDPGWMPASYEEGENEIPPELLDQQPPLRMNRIGAWDVYSLQEYLSKTQHELLTPLAASRLFKRSSEAVRTAVRIGHVASVCTVALSSKPVRLISVNSAIKYWKKPLDFPEEIKRLRLYGVIINVQYYLYFVLHTTSVIVRPTTLLDSLPADGLDDSYY